MPEPVRTLVDRLADLRGVEAVALGGSRAQGAHHADSDWDLGVYYRGPFDPADVRDLGYRGTVVEIGEWGGGVFNGGAWLSLDGTTVDLLWRDLDTVDHEIAEASAGRWHLEPLMFHLTGIPTYLLLAELNGNQVLIGELPRPSYPEALRITAGRDWAQRAELTLGHAAGHARHGRVTACVGLVAVGACEFAHAVAATAGRWVTNDKTLLHIGAMDGVDELVRDTLREVTPDRLRDLVDATLMMGRRSVAQAV